MYMCADVIKNIIEAKKWPDMQLYCICHGTILKYVYIINAFFLSNCLVMVMLVKYT